MIAAAFQGIDSPDVQFMFVIVFQPLFRICIHRMPSFYIERLVQRCRLIDICFYILYGFVAPSDGCFRSKDAAPQYCVQKDDAFL